MKKVVFSPQFYRRKLTLKRLSTLSNEPTVASCRTILRCIKLLANNYILNACYVLGFFLGTGKIAMNRTDKNTACVELMF